MNFHRAVNASPPSEFQLAPMLDVVFLLLCFFITTAVFSQWEYEIDVQLPTSTTGHMPERLPGDVILNINREGVISINQVTLGHDELLARLGRLAQLYPGQSVIIRADRLTPFENVMNVIDTCRQADIWNLLFATGDGEAQKIQ